MTGNLDERADAPSPAVTYITLRCPIRSCTWTVLFTQLRDEPSTWLTCNGVLEVLAHVIGRYGDGGRVHTIAEVEAVPLEEMLHPVAVGEARL